VRVYIVWVKSLIVRVTRPLPETTDVTWNPQPVHHGTKYTGIVEQLRTAIQTGELRPGDRLPTHRALAGALGVTISTVTQAYAEAARAHLIGGEVGRGTFVLSNSADAQLFAATALITPTGSTSSVDLSANTPAIDRRSTALVDGITELATRGSLTEGYPSGATLLRGRLAMAELLRRGRVDRREHEIVLTAGAQHALLVTLLLLCGPGSRVLAEELTFPGLKSVARQLRIELIPVRADSHGIVPDDLDRQAKRSSASALVCVPALQNPTGASMNDERLHAVAAVARRRNMILIEDDVYRALTNCESLSSVAPERTVLITSVSKTVEPALRLGAIAGPVDLIGPLAKEAHLSTWMAATASVELFARWCVDGTAQRRVAWQRAEVMARWRMAESVFGDSALIPSPHRFIPLTRSPDRAVDDLAAAGVVAVSSTALGVGPHPRKGIRLSLTAAPSRQALRLALGRVRSTLGSRIDEG
jgi:DNA-binding transcriptional MocR family regulator